MDFKQIMQRVGQFVDRYRRGIIIGLLLCCVLQQCTINQLRHERNQLLNTDQITRTVTDAADEVGDAIGDALSTQQSHQSNTGLITLVIILVVAAAVVGAYRFGLFSGGVVLKGSIHQDLTGRIIYSLTINNRSRKAVTIDNTQIEFRSTQQERKFRTPVPDFPLTLTARTKHTVNISLRQLLEKNPDLINYRFIRSSVECDGVRRSSIPLSVKWKR